MAVAVVAVGFYLGLGVGDGEAASEYFILSGILNLAGLEPPFPYFMTKFDAEYFDV